MQRGAELRHLEANVVLIPSALSVPALETLLAASQLLLPSLTGRETEAQASQTGGHGWL